MSDAGRPPWRHYLLLVIAGTVVRAMLAGWTALWDFSADQAAWGLGLEAMAADGRVSYAGLMHYPHEGGSWLVGLVALLFRPLAELMPPLVWTTLLLDALVRYAQIVLAHRLVGASVARWFAWWTVFAAPLMLPWSVVACGLHALLSFAPLLIVAMLHRPPVVQGLLVGLLAGLAYDVWALFPVMLGALAIQRGTQRWSAMALAAVGATIGFAPHLLMRLCLDDGFHLEGMGLLSIRGLEQGGMDLRALPERAAGVLLRDLPAAFTLLPVASMGARWLALAGSLLIVVVLRACWRRGYDAPELRALVAMVVLFAVVLIIAPFQERPGTGAGPLHYRYHVFILPLLMLLVFTAMGQARRWMAPVLIAGCATLTVGYAITRERSPLNYEAVGWVLARKHGHDVAHMTRLVQLVPTDKRPSVVFGMGWGTAAALFDRREPDQQGADRLRALVAAMPPEWQQGYLHGVERAFAPGITPVLDPRWRTLIPEARTP